MAKTVKVTRRPDTDNEKTLEFELKESGKSDANWFLPKGTDGFHFDKLESVESFFEKKYPNADIDISG